MNVDVPSRNPPGTAQVLPIRQPDGSSSIKPSHFSNTNLAKIKRQLRRRYLEDQRVKSNREPLSETSMTTDIQTDETYYDYLIPSDRSGRLLEELDNESNHTLHQGQSSDSDASLDDLVDPVSQPYINNQ